MHSVETNLQAASRFQKSIATCLLCKLKKLDDHLDPFEQVYRPAVFFGKISCPGNPQKKKPVRFVQRMFLGGENGPKLPDLKELVLEIIHILDNKFQHVAKISQDS